MKIVLPERMKVRVIIRGSFSKLIEELEEIEAKEDIDEVLERTFGYFYKEHFFNKRTKKHRIKRDFTFAKYVELCDEKIRKSDCTLLTVENIQL